MMYRTKQDVSFTDVVNETFDHLIFTKHMRTICFQKVTAIDHVRCNIYKKMYYGSLETQRQKQSLTTDLSIGYLSA